MTQTQKQLRGHHLYQLYKAYQLKQRGVVLRIWDYLAKNFIAGAPYFEVSDRAFGGPNPDKIKNIKRTLNHILETPNIQIIFTNKAIKDAICESCPSECFFSGEYSAQDDLVLKATNLETEKPCNLSNLSKIFVKGKDGWAIEYEDAFFNIGHYFGYDWEIAISELKRKREKTRALDKNDK